MQERNPGIPERGMNIVKKAGIVGTVGLLLLGPGSPVGMALLEMSLIAAGGGALAENQFKKSR